MNNLLLLFLISCLVAFSQAGKVDRHTPRLKPGKTSFASHVTRGKQRNGKFRTATLSLSSTETNVVLELEPNNDLLSEDYQEIEINAQGQKKISRRAKDVKVCWFHGKISGEEDSDVLASDCNGEGFQGLIKRASGKSYIAKGTGKDDEIAVYATEDEETSKGTCGVDHSDHGHAKEVHSVESAPFSAPRRRLLESDASVNVVEIALVNDRKYIMSDGGAFGRNLTAVGERNIQIMNLVQATYLAASFAKPTSIRLKAQYFFATNDPYLMAQDANGEVDDGDLLAKFRDWSISLPSYDHVHLMTDYDFEASTIGLAYVGGACTLNRVGMSMMAGSVVQVANTVAHELGHSLGMSHDGGTTGCSNTGFLMAPASSCPTTGLCPVSSCSIASKNTFSNKVVCLQNWNEPACTDGIMNGNELGVDCGGSCAPCGLSTSCSVNNGGCSHTCTPLGSSYVCGCYAGWYLDDTYGTRCIQDIDQCLSKPCQETCTNTVGPGDSYVCSCRPPNYLSLFDGKSCEPESCFDRRKNQDELMIDCGGVCARQCTCLISTATTQYSYDRGFALTGAKWQSWDNTNQHQTRKFGVPIKYVYKQSDRWSYGTDVSSSVYGMASSTSPLPYSGLWQMYSGSQWVYQPFTFVPCPAYSASTCGNGKVEGGEECDSCLVFENGKCLKANPCCDSTCLAPSLRGTSCAVDGAPGACWDGSCVTRGAACEVTTGTAFCFGASTAACNVYTGGQKCAGVYPAIAPTSPLPTFTASACTETFFCYDSTCQKTNLVMTQINRIGPIRGYPCSAPDDNGRYPFVCDGGVRGTGQLSTCVSVDSLIDYPLSPSDVITEAPTPETTEAPTPRTTEAPTPRITEAPTPRITEPPTRVLTQNGGNGGGPVDSPKSPPTGPTTSAPTRKLTRMPTSKPTRIPTRFPTTDTPTSQRPTRAPTPKPTGKPTFEPTTRAPVTMRPTRAPTLEPTSKPTPEPTTRAPVSVRPSRIPTSQKPTRVSTLRPTSLPTNRPTYRSTREPTTIRPPTAKPTRAPAAKPTRRPTQKPTSRPTRVPTLDR